MSGGGKSEGERRGGEEKRKAGAAFRRRPPVRFENRLGQNRPPLLLFSGKKSYWEHQLDIGRHLLFGTAATLDAVIGDDRGPLTKLSVCFAPFHQSILPEFVEFPRGYFLRPSKPAPEIRRARTGETPWVSRTGRIARRAWADVLKSPLFVVIASVPGHGTASIP